jgi:hypothetical protein
VSVLSEVKRVDMQGGAKTLCELFLVLSMVSLAMNSRTPMQFDVFMGILSRFGDADASNLLDL